MNRRTSQRPLRRNLNFSPVRCGVHQVIQFFCGFDEHIWELSTDGIICRKLTEELNRNIVGVVAERNTHIIWQSSNAQSICIQTHDTETKHEGLYQIQVAEARSTPLFEVPMRLIPPWAGGFDLRVVGYGTQIVYMTEHTTYPAKIWRFDIVSGKRRQVADLNPHLSDIHFGETRFIESQTADGQRLRGIFDAACWLQGWEALSFGYIDLSGR